MRVWKGITYTVGWDTKNLWLQGIAYKNFWRFVLPHKQSQSNMWIIWTLLRIWYWRLVVPLRSLPWTPFHLVQRWGLLPMWWSPIYIRSQSWRHCPLQGQSSCMISLFTRRLIYVDTFSIYWRRALRSRTLGLSCPSQLSLWALLQSQGSNFRVASLWFRGTILLVHTQWLGA